jgi:hypothetical protein
MPELVPFGGHVEVAFGCWLHLQRHSLDYLHAVGADRAVFARVVGQVSKAYLSTDASDSGWP